MSVEDHRTARSEAIGNPTSKLRHVLRARVVLPVSRPSIENGAVVISGGRIAAVGRWRELAREARGKVEDLGDVVLMPGLVNAHCHLDYTDMAGLFPPPKIFIDWLKVITAAKSVWTYADYEASWRNGAQMLLRTGTTTVGDIEAAPRLLPAMWHGTPLRILSFLEMIGLTQRRKPQEIVQEAIDKLGSLNAPGCDAGLSPHAPYTTLPELVRLTAAAARRHQWRVCTHVAESALEFDMFRRGRGLMFDWISHSGRDMSDCGKRSPVQHLEKCELLGENLLAVHANYLAKGDARLLGQRKVSVAHCPRSHTYFRHEPFPLQQLTRAGVNVCLGTDSLASVLKVKRERVELSLFEEMRTLASRQPGISPRAILRMATLNGARALGMAGCVGELAPRAFADLITLPQAGKPGDVWEQVLHHSGPVAASMIGGKWVGDSALKTRGSP